MIGIQGTGPFDKIIETAIQKISILEVDMPYETIDFYVIDQDDPDISEFMIDNITPFYIKVSKTVH